MTQTETILTAVFIVMLLVALIAMLTEYTKALKENRACIEKQFMLYDKIKKQQEYIHELEHNALESISKQDITTSMFYFEFKDEIAKHVICKPIIVNDTVKGITATIRKKTKNGYENFPVKLKVL